MNDVPLLSDLRIDEAPPLPPAIPMLPTMTGLSFDQTIRHTGWAVIDSSPEGLAVRERGTHKTVNTGMKGWESTVDDAMEMIEHIRTTISIWREAIDVIVYERPMVVGGMRNESSMLVGLGICLLAEEHEVEFHVMSAQKGKTAAHGYANAKKAKVAEGLRAKPWIKGTTLLRNEHENDAVANFLAFAMEDIHAPR